MRNAIFRAAPSLWQSPPDVVGPLVETVVQTVIHDVDIALHFYRDRIELDDRRSPFEEVDFVAERTDGTVLPIEVKFRRTIGADDLQATRRFVERFKSPAGFVVSRDTWLHTPPLRVIPLCDFLLGF